MIKWLFFDMGSTLIDESECYRIRNLETTVHSNVTLNKFEETQRYYAHLNQYYYACACRQLSLTRRKWHGEFGQPYPYTAETIAFFYRKYHLGIIANQMPGTKERLKKWGLLPYFSVVASSDEIGIEKPETGLFFAAVELADCRPDEAVMIGDRLDNDIKPAQRVGMKTIWVKKGYGRYGDPSLLSRQPDLTADTVEELMGKDMDHLTGSAE
jgi:HAD superfamily hydrolase (TIGR01549 family)